MTDNEYGTLAGTRWTIATTSGSAEVVQNNYIRFSQDMTTIELSTDGSSFTAWGTCSGLQNGDLAGTTLDGRPFVIQLASSQLSCQLQDPATGQRRIVAAGLSAALGALIGAVAGLAGSRSVAAALIGAVGGGIAALAGSLATSGAGSWGHRVGSSGTWTATDGDINVRIVRPHAVPAAGA